MPDEPITPALTPEQWAARGGDIPEGPAQDWSRACLSTTEAGHVYVEEFWEDHCASVHIHPRALHAVAALCLHGQRYGFTHKEAGDVLETIELINGEYELTPEALDELLESVRRIAAKITALLPPRSEENADDE